MSDLNAAAARTGGKFIKCTTTADGPIKGIYMAWEERDKMFEGVPVLGRKSGKPRREWLFTLKTDLRDPADPTDDGTRLLACNERAQSVIGRAIKAAGGATEGDELLLAVTTDPTTDKSGDQDYTAQWRKGTALTAAVEANSGGVATPAADPFAGL